MKIPFNKPYLTGKEKKYISIAQKKNILAGDGPFTKKCQYLINNLIKVNNSFLTHSCTASLEMAAILLNISEGDEIIMPSYTFVSTANAFVLRGGIPVFVDINYETLNINENLIEPAITNRTKAIVVVHYAGICSNMDYILEIAKKYKLLVIEDNAQGFLSKYKNKFLGSLGDLAAISFHETKNIISGEGGALIVNNNKFKNRAEIIREKGTDRVRFFKGKVNKYTWQDIGSSYLPGEIIAAFLYAQMINTTMIIKKRMQVWEKYNELLCDIEKKGILVRQKIPNYCEHNAHMFYIVLSKDIKRELVITKFNRSNIGAISHYVPLHSSPAGRKYARTASNMNVTNFISRKIIRLPLWIGLEDKDIEKVVNIFKKI